MRVPARTPAASRGRPTGAVAAQSASYETLAANAFDRFPNPVMVCDAKGRVVAANARLRAELGAAADGAASCCSLLGCGLAGTALEDGCLTARVLAHSDEPLEVLVDSAGGWLRVSAAPLYEDRSHVVVELRRERRETVAQPSLRVFTLGSLRVEGADGPLGGDWLDQRAGQLLRYLACERRRVAPADTIAEAIWPQAGPAAATSVRHFVHALRERLEPERPPGARSYVVCRNGGYALAAGQVWIDADEFEREARRGLTALAAGDVRDAERRLARAAQIYEDDFLSDAPYAEWALAERERLRASACNVLRALADIRAGRPEAAACLERLAAMEPFDSDVQQRLIATWLRVGRRTRAARHYQAFRWRLMREFGEAPGFELAELAAGVADAA